MSKKANRHHGKYFIYFRTYPQGMVLVFLSDMAYTNILIKALKYTYRQI